MKFEQQQEEIKQLIKHSEYEQAKFLLIECLNEKPNELPAYHLLGTVYEKLGAQDCARECFLGRLPDNIQQSDFALDVSRIIENSIEVHNLPAHTASTQQCHSSSLENHPATNAYKHRPLKSKATGVHMAIDSKLWYDGFNTVLFDKNDQIEKSVSSTNLAPVCNAVLNKSANVYQGRVVLMGAQGSNNYYHWLADILPKFAILKKSGIDITNKTKFAFTNVTQKFQVETLALLGVEQEQIIETWKEGCYLAADEILVPYLSNDMGLSMGGWLPEYLKSVFISDTSTIQSGKILISRDLEKSHGRGITNIVEFNQYYLDKGYELVVPEHYTVQQQAHMFSCAKAIAGAHGAGLANLLFCQPDTSVVEVFGPHFAPCYWAVSELNGLDYRNVNCVAHEETLPPAQNQVEQAKTLASRRSQNFTVPMAVL